MDTITMEAPELNGYLTKSDEAYLQQMDQLYAKAMQSFEILESTTRENNQQAAKDSIIAI